MGNWSLNEIIECTRYGLLVVYMKDDYLKRQVCRRIRRKKERIYAEEVLYMRLPKNYNNNSVFLTEGDLVFISQDKVCSILRNSKDETFAFVVNGKLTMNENFFKE